MSLADVSAAEWQRIRGIADSLLDISPDQWEVVSRTEFGENESLRRAALELARSFDDSPDLLGCKPFPKIGQPMPETTVAPGDRIGAYKIEREIGRGGMGRVYAASRADGAFEKNVAVKLIRLPGSAAIERFRAERRILAGLEHENIARLFDAGTTPDGALYFIMEYVDGVPLDIYCRNSDRKSIIRLFHAVVTAVAYAHRCGVIHRDLKPANILVTAAGIPKLLDFGIASLNSDPGTAPTIGITPAFASPEQRAGVTATERSDVYTLGVLLRSLLQDSPQLPDDLAAILGKAAAEDPRFRYDTAGELADDLRRSLGSYPVHALPVTWKYRLLCFNRRHRIPVFLAAALLSLSAAVVAGVIWQQHHNEEQLRAADEIARRVLAEETGLRGLAGTTEIRRSLVQDALNHLKTVAPEGARDPNLAGDLADADIRIGMVLGLPGLPSLGDYPAAEASIRRGRALAENIARRWPDLPRGHELLAMGLSYEEALLGWRGDDAGCIRQGERAQAEFTRIHYTTPDLGAALDQNEGMLARCYVKVGRMDAAVRIIRQWIAREEKNPTTVNALPTAWGRLARSLYEAGDLDGGRAAFRETIRLDREIYRRKPSHASQMILAQELISAAAARPQPCRDREDLSDIRESAQLAGQAYTEDRENATAFALAADSQRCLAMNLVVNGQPSQSLRILDQNRQLLLSRDPALPAARNRLAENWLEASRTSQALRDLKTAGRDAQEALDVMMKAHLQPTDELLVTDCFSRLKEVGFAKGQTSEALSYAREQIDAARSYAKGIPGQNTTLELARNLQSVGDDILASARDEGLADLKEAVEKFESVPAPPANETAEARLDLLRASENRR